MTTLNNAEKKAWRNEAMTPTGEVATICSCGEAPVKTNGTRNTVRCDKCGKAINYGAGMMAEDAVKRLDR